MTILSDQERRRVIHRSSAAISRIQEGEDAIGVLSQIYCENLPDKSLRQGELMAQELLSWISHFQASFDEALEGAGDYFCRAITEILAQLPLEEQCEFLGQELGVSVEQAQVSEALRDSLLRKAWSQISESEGMMALQPGVVAPEDLQLRNSAKEIVGEEMLLAVTSMVIYTMAKNAELSNVPEKISLAQITVGVCVEDKLTELGSLKENNIEKQLCALKAVCFTGLLAAATGVAGGLAGLSLAPVAALCGYVLLWLGVVLYVYYKATSEMLQEEADQTPYIPVLLYPAEEVKEEKKQIMQKHQFWLEPKQQQEQKYQTQAVKPELFTEG